MELLSATGLLLLTTDPLGNVPSFISVLQSVPVERRRAVVVRELFFALGIMLAFLIGGRQLTSLLGIRPEAISVAGAIVLFLVALEMILPGRGRRGANGAEEGARSSCRWRRLCWRGRPRWRRSFSSPANQVDC